MKQKYTENYVILGFMNAIASFNSVVIGVHILQEHFNKAGLTTDSREEL